MPVEIRELIIRARVEPSGQDDPQTDSLNGSSGKESCCESEVARLVNEQLKRKKER